MPLRRRGALAARHPSRRRSLPPAAERPPDAFERLVTEALDTLPAEARALLASVAIVIEDWPEGDGSRDPGEDGWLYGLYEGTPLVEYGADLVPFPNRITLYRGPLEADFPHPGDLADEVRITVLHELAHHVGMDHDRLDELGLG